jgi:HEAT repeat protein
MTTLHADDRRARARHADDEIRYRGVAALDAADPADRALLLQAMGDASWRVRIAAVDRLGEAPDPGAVVPPLLDALVGVPSVGARESAGAALARIGAPAVPGLVERLGAADPELRQAAADVLGAIQDRRTVPALAAALADPDPNVRAASARALGRVGGPEAQGALLAALDSDDATLRLAALEALCAQRIAPPAEKVRALLRDRSTRAGAYRVLGGAQEPEAIALLAAGLVEGTRTVREAALAAVGLLRSRRTAEDLEPLARGVRALAARHPAAAEACVAALRSEEPFVPVGALSALAWLGSARHAAAALRLADDDRLRPVVEEVLEAAGEAPGLKEALAEALPGLGPLGRIAALAGLSRLGSPAALESLLRAAAEPDAVIQPEAIGALGRLGDARAVPILAGLLADDAPGIAGVAATALGRIAAGPAPGRGAVLGALRGRAGASPSAPLYRVLGAVGEEGDVPALAAGLGSELVVRRIAAAGALGTLGQRRATRTQALVPLVGALADPAWAVRTAAARALADHAAAVAAAGPGDPARAGAARALEAALGDEEPSVRAGAAEALGAWGEAARAGAIAALLLEPDPSPPVAAAALRALTALGAPPADAVARAAEHADPEVVKEAVAAAARVPGGAGERVLREAAASPRWDVRRAAALAFAARRDPALRAEAERLAGADPDPLVARAFAEAARALGR